MKKYKLSEIFESPISGEWGSEIEEGTKGSNVLRTTNFTNLGRLDLSDVVKRDIDLIKYENKMLKNGDIIIEKSGGSITQPVGRVVIFDIDENEPYFCNNFTSILRPTDKLKPKYALYLMKRLYDTRKVLNFQNQTTGIINLKLNDYISKTEVIIPTLDTQKKIIEVLDKSQELIDKRKEQIKLLDELVKSRFIEMFGNPFADEKNFGINKLSDVTVINPKKLELKNIDKELEVSFIPMENVGEKGELSLKNSKLLKEVYSGFTYFRNNDVLFAKITPCMENGKGAIAKDLINGIGFGSTEFHIIRPIDKKSNPYWIYNLTTLIEFRRLAERKMSGSAGQKRVPIDFLNSLLVVVPPIELQNEFAEFVQKVDKIKSQLEESLKELEDNFNSLMQKAFKGELFN